MPRHLTTLLIACSCLWLHAAASESDSEYLVRFGINSSRVDISYSDNAKALAGIIAGIDSISPKGGLHEAKIILSGSASPDGPLEFNRQLACKRLNSLRQYISRNADMPESMIETRIMVTDWEMLASMIEKSDMPGKCEALAVIRNVPEYTIDSAGRRISSRKNKLIALNGGSAWRYMMKHFFADLRHAFTVFVSRTETPDKLTASAGTVVSANGPHGMTAVKATATEALTPADTCAFSPSERPYPAPAVIHAADHGDKKPFHMSVSTNMLYDALLVPNAGVEFYLGKGWSVAADWMYGWWPRNSRHRYWRVYGGDLTICVSTIPSTRPAMRPTSI